MHERDNEISSGSIWKRLLYMLLFALVFSIAETVVYISALVAFISVLFGGSVNNSVKSFGRNLGRYVNQIVSFLTFNTDEEPFPFKPWPGNEAELLDATDTSETQVSNRSKTAAYETTNQSLNQGAKINPDKVTDNKAVKKRESENTE